ncbi:MAG: PP2C family serine/threonine-protein phosphatase [Vicinamibacterales bacterium]
MELTAGGRTDSGPRPGNQDWLHWDLDLGLFVVADGMGGHNAGEVAAHLAVDAVRRFVTESREWRDLTWPFGFDAAASPAANRLLTAVRLANRRVWSEGVTHDAFNGMGTTIVAVLTSGDRMTVVSIGDSRVYRWRRGRLAQLTSDDTWLTAMVQAGVDPAALPAGHPMRHVLTSVVGGGEDVSPAVTEEVLEPGDRILLCSDGVHGALGDDRLADILGADTQAEVTSRALVEAALAAGSTDNATALVIAAR